MRSLFESLLNWSLFQSEAYIQIPRKSRRGGRRGNGARLCKGQDDGQVVVLGAHGQRYRWQRPQHGGLEGQGRSGCQRRQCVRCFVCVCVCVLEEIDTGHASRVLLSLRHDERGIQGNGRVAQQVFRTRVRYASCPHCDRLPCPLPPLAALFRGENAVGWCSPSAYPHAYPRTPMLEPQQTRHLA